MFGEKTKEYDSVTKKELEVWQSPKYIESKKAAIKLIEETEYIEESDFWILMNRTKNNKMAYTGLIISHNGCLKINDHASEKFRPECMTLDKDGYNGSLVYTYICQGQGIYEVGEVSPKNCKNDYPYAMALKRCFDRVVLKLCKLAYSGVYSDSEADEFKEKLTAPEKKALKEKEEKKADALNEGFQQVMDSIPMATEEQVEAIRKGCAIAKINEKELLKKSGYSRWEDLPEITAANTIAFLNRKSDELISEGGVA